MLKEQKSDIYALHKITDLPESFFFLSKSNLIFLSETSGECMTQPICKSVSILAPWMGFDSH